MNSPAGAPLDFSDGEEIRGHKIRLYVGGIFVAHGGPARESQPRWIIEIDGTQQFGPLVDLERHNTLPGVTEMLGEWAKQNEALLR